MHHSDGASTFKLRLPVAPRSTPPSYNPAMKQPTMASWSRAGSFLAVAALVLVVSWFGTPVDSAGPPHMRWGWFAFGVAVLLAAVQEGARARRGQPSAGLLGL